MFSGTAQNYLGFARTKQGSGAGTESEVKVEEETGDGTCGGAERGVVKGNTEEGAYTSAQKKIAAQAKKPRPGPLSPYSPPPKHFSFWRRSSQRRSTSA